MIANEDSDYFTVGLFYCEGQRDGNNEYIINSKAFAIEFSKECILKEPIEDLLKFALEFYAQYRETYLKFSQIVGSGL